jgi:uncharacterized membrane protein YkgB
MIYQLYKAFPSDIVNAAKIVNADPLISFLFNPDNSDYQEFKTNVLAGAELQDADGNVMTQEQADAFIATLP